VIAVGCAPRRPAAAVEEYAHAHVKRVSMLFSDLVTLLRRR
jgi:hypothetical protein